MTIKPLVLCTASAFAMLVASAASAQTEPQTPPSGTLSDQAPEDEGTATDDIVVTGVRASIVGALNVRKESTQIVDSIVSEDIGKLPDNNVIEALQRVTGVQVTNRGAGEASGISIRGLSDPLTTMNGRNIFTASGRAFALQDIPANLVRRIDVYKTRAASQIETGIAGQIDVFTRRPFDFDGFAISGLARGIYNEQADKIDPNLSLLVSNRWETGIGDIGVLVNGSYQRTRYREQSITSGAMVPFATENPPAGSGLTPLQRIFPGANNENWRPGLERGLSTEPGSTLNINGVETPYYLSRDAVFSPDVHGERERPAINAAVQWSPNESSTYTAEFFWNGFRSTTQNSLMFSFADWWGALGPNPGSTFTLYDDTNIIKTRSAGDVFGFNSGDYTKSSTDTYVYALNGAWKVGDSAKITADLSYQKSQFDTQFLAMRVDRVAPRIDVDFNTGNGFPSYNFDDNSRLTDASAWRVGEFYDNANRSEGDALTLHLDAEKSWDSGFFRNVRAGIRIDDRKAADSVRTQDAGILGSNFASLGEDAQFLSSGFFQGRADVPTSWLVPNGQYIYENTDQIRQLYRDAGFANIQLSDQLGLTRVFDINEVSMAFYLQGDAQIDVFGRPLQIQGGVRYVDVDTDLTFVDRLTQETQSTSQMTRRLLPSVTLRYNLFDNLRLRFNYGQTLRRPGFGDLNPFFQLVGDLTNIGFGTGTAGNANLQPTRSSNYDAAIEWYFERDSAIYATFFRREIDGLVVPIRTRLTIPNSGQNTDSFVITRPENASNGVLEGVELGLTYFPTYLPGLLDGLGIQGSLTLLDSSQNIPVVDGAGNIVGQDESAFFGVSDVSYNVTLAYDHGPVALRLSHIWRKAWLNNNEAALFANPIGVWRRPEQSLDFQLTYRVTDQVGITFDAVNLTNETQRSYYRFEDAGGQDTHNLGNTLLPRTFAIGARFTFD